ncbi:MAG: hypothetical protein IJ780_01665 [Neisseriaceae bacterium]|nr:hypothetical protein [Neisseriaceae bacterium]
MPTAKSCRVGILAHRNGQKHFRQPDNIIYKPCGLFGGQECNALWCFLVGRNAYPTVFFR